MKYSGFKEDLVQLTNLKNRLFKKKSVNYSIAAFLLASCGGGGGSGTGQQQSTIISSNLVSINTSSTKILNGQVATITLTFTEQPVNFSSQNLTVANGSLSTGAFDTSGLVFTTTFTPNSSVNGQITNVTIDNQWLGINIVSA